MRGRSEKAKGWKRHRRLEVLGAARLEEEREHLGRFGPEEISGEPRQLTLMKWLLQNAAGANEIEEIVLLRKWAQTNLKGFMEAKTKLELAVLATKAVEAAAVPVVRDLGSDHCLRVARSWLKARLG